MVIRLHLKIRLSSQGGSWTISDTGKGKKANYVLDVGDFYLAGFIAGDLRNTVQAHMDWVCVECIAY